MIIIVVQRNLRSKSKAAEVSNLFEITLSMTALLNY